MFKNSKIKNTKFKILLKRFIFAVLVFGFCYFTYSAVAAEADFKLTPPGISEATARSPEFVSEYLPWLLRVLLGSVGILATLMIIVGGLQYVAAGASGNPEKVSDAKNRILMAIGGLILALGSWLILSVINPDLLKLELKLPSVGQKQTQEKTTEETPCSAGDIDTSKERCVDASECPGFGPIQRVCQSNGYWGTWTKAKTEECVKSDPNCTGPETCTITRGSKPECRPGDSEKDYKNCTLPDNCFGRKSKTRACESDGCWSAWTNWSACQKINPQCTGERAGNRTYCPGNGQDYGDEKSCLTNCSNIRGLQDWTCREP